MQQNLYIHNFESRLLCACVLYDFPESHYVTGTCILQFPHAWCVLASHRCILE